MRSHTLSSTETSRRVFGRGSPVLDYWLGHSEGFELTSPGGDHRGVVEEVVIDERGYPRALVVRGGVLQREQVVDVDSVEAVVPADGTITLRSSRRKRARPRFARSTHAARGDGAALLGAGAAAVRIVWSTAVVTLALAGRAGTSAAVWARPYAGTLAHMAAAAAVTAALFLVALVHALADAVAAYARFVAGEWRQRRSGRARK